MAETANTEGRRAWRFGVVALLVAAYAALGAYLHLVLRTNIVYTHFGYIPIVLAGVWWGRRAVLVAGVLGLIVFAFHLFGVGAGGVWNDAARVLFFVVVALCIGTLSDRVKEGQDALLASERKHRWLVEESFAGVFMCRDAEILFVNARLAKMLGYGGAELLGRPIWDLFPAEERPHLFGLIARRRAEGPRDLQYECRMIRKDGGLVWADVASAATTYQGQPAVIVNVFDISDRKRAEEKQRELAELARRQQEQLVHSARLAELGEMGAAIAHELNQPLTGIRNFARNAMYMIDNDLGDTREVRENLRLISDQVDRASRIINQMRELTRRSERQLGPVDINRTVRESVEFLIPQIRLSGVEVALDPAADLPQIIGDRIRLEQVFLNLLTNARQAMEESAERHLRVRTYFDAGKDCPVVVEIADTGKGFAEEDAEKLFTPFYTTKKAGHGTGLGLSISLTIIKDHNGAIEALGRPGKGAIFTVRLPVGRPQEAAERATKDA